MELFYVAVVTECIRPPSGVLRLVDGGRKRGYVEHAVSFEGTEKFPAFLTCSVTFFFFLCVGEGGCVVVGRRFLEVW
jgi:hypothetical protein